MARNRTFILCVVNPNILSTIIIVARSSFSLNRTTKFHSIKNKTNHSFYQRSATARGIPLYMMDKINFYRYILILIRNLQWKIITYKFPFFNKRERERETLFFLSTRYKRCQPIPLYYKWIEYVCLTSTDIYT